MADEDYPVLDGNGKVIVPAAWQDEGKDLYPVDNAAGQTIVADAWLDAGKPQYPVYNAAGDLIISVEQGGGSTFEPELRISDTSIDEGATTGRVVGTLMVLNGSGSYTYTITSDTDSKFAISGSDLVTAAALDYETKTSHNVTIQADNGVDTPISQAFVIEVNNVIEGTLAPTTATFDASMSPGTVIATVTGFDVGANEVIVSVTPNDGRLAFNDTQVLTGLSASSAGVINAVIATSAGRTLNMAITVTEPAVSPFYVADSYVRNGLTVTIPTPVGTQVGDRLIVYLASNNRTALPDTPAGWTMLYEFRDGSYPQITLNVYTRVVPEGMPANTVFNKNNSTMLGMMVTYRKDGGTPAIDVLGTLAASIGTGVALAPSVTATETGLLVLYTMGSVGNGTVSSFPSEFATRRYANPGSTLTALLFDKADNPVGATGDKQVLWDQVANTFGSILMQLK